MCVVLHIKASNRCYAAAFLAIFPDATSPFLTQESDSDAEKIRLALDEGANRQADLVVGA